MKSSFRLNDSVADDLDGVWNFIAADDPLAADAFIDELFDVFERLSQNPRIGRQRDDLSPGLRGFPHGSYMILYHIKYETIEIDRVIHGARNLYAIFHPDN